MKKNRLVANWRYQPLENPLAPPRFLSRTRLEQDDHRPHAGHEAERRTKSVDSRMRNVVSRPKTPRSHWQSVVTMVIIVGCPQMTKNVDLMVFDLVPQYLSTGIDFAHGKVWGRRLL